MQADPHSLLDCILRADKEGYKEIFLVSDSQLVSADGGRRYSPDKIVIADFYRLVAPGQTDSRSTVYLIETSDKRKGVVVETSAMKPEERFINFISPPGTH